MRKYIIKKADGSEQIDMPASHNTKRKAIETLMHYIECHNVCLYDANLISPCDYKIETVDLKVDEIIPDFETARKKLSNTSNPSINNICTLLNEINIKHLNVLIALNRLFTIAEAWNKEDGFVPDFSDTHQNKWFPLFKYDKDAARFVCVDTGHTFMTYAGFGSRICFISHLRAKQFGKQFEELYNEVFLIPEDNKENDYK